MTVLRSEREDIKTMRVPRPGIRPELEDLTERGGSIGAVGDDIEIAAVRAERHEGFPQERERVRDEESNRMNGFHVPATSLSE
jgi:hypothetical protein